MSNTIVWQKCPACDGTGKDTNDVNRPVNTRSGCPTCKGKRIISKVTGKPPRD